MTTIIFHKLKKEPPGWLTLTPIYGTLLLIISVVYLADDLMTGDFWVNKTLSNDPEIRELINKIAEAA